MADLHLVSSSAPSINSLATQEKSIREYIFEKFHWVRDMLTATLIAGSTFLIQVHKGLVTQEQRLWLAISIIAPYALILIGNIAWRFVKAPYLKLKDREKYLQTTLADLETRNQELAKALAANDTVAANQWEARQAELVMNLQVVQAKINEKNEEIERLKQRPCIVPVTYAKVSEKDFAAGLIIANDGEPAYDISIPDIKLGPSTVTITPNFTRLSKEDGGRFCEVWIRNPHGMMLSGSGLLETMRIQEIGEVTFPIRYKDSNENPRWYVTTCKLKFDTIVLGGIGNVGIDVMLVKQELETVNQTK